MKKLTILVVPLLILALSLGAVACGGGAGDEEQVVKLIDHQVTAFNDRDWHAAYVTMSPNYRATCSYQELKDFSEQAMALYVMTFGAGKLKATDISVSVEGEWAYATLKLLYNDRVLAELTSTAPDIWRKVDGTWYDVTEDPMDPGYNADDLPENGVVWIGVPTTNLPLENRSK